MWIYVGGVLALVALVVMGVRPAWVHKADKGVPVCDTVRYEYPGSRFLCHQDGQQDWVLAVRPKGE
jgi:hypothetical protein